MRKEISGLFFALALIPLLSLLLIPGEVLDTLDGKLPLMTVLPYLKGIMTGLLIGVLIVIGVKCGKA